MKLSEIKNKIAESKWNLLVMWILRLSVGAVLVFSGFVKAVDPWGSYYKFSEYLNAFGFDSLRSLAKAASLVVPLVEFSLGSCLIIGMYRKFVATFLAFFMAVMLMLTFYLATTDLVPDCGCFGDVVVLSNWHTFFKNVALFIAIVYLYIFRNTSQSIIGESFHWLIIILLPLYIFIIFILGYWYQPLIDFRPFKEGTYLLSVEEEEKLNHDESEDFVYIYERNDEQKEFVIDSIPEDDEWEYVDRRRINRVEKPDTGDNRIVIEDKDREITGELLDHSQNQLIYLFPDIEEVDISYSFFMNDFTAKAEEQGYNVFALSPASKQQIDEWYDLSMASYKIYKIDDSDLKMIARGNPAVVCLQNGVIVWKRTFGSIMNLHDDEKDLKIDELKEDLDCDALLIFFTDGLLILLLLLFILNRSPKMIKFNSKIIRLFKK